MKLTKHEEDYLHRITVIDLENKTKTLKREILLKEHELLMLQYETEMEARKHCRKGTHKPRKKSKSLPKISGSDRKKLKESQSNKCAICGAEGSALRDLSVDHNHETGQIRGMLCNLCNLALGLMRENPEFLLRAINYLKVYNIE